MKNYLMSLHKVFSIVSKIMKFEITLSGKNLSEKSEESENDGKVQTRFELSIL